MVWDVEEGRPAWQTIPLRVGLTLLLLLLTGLTSIGVVLSGGLADQVGNLLGVGDSAVMVWNLAKWPVIVLLVSLMFSILYYATPNVRQPGFRWVTPGRPARGDPVDRCRRSPSPSTSPTSAPTTRPTAPSAA